MGIMPGYHFCVVIKRNEKTLIYPYGTFWICYFRLYANGKTQWENFE